MVAEQIENKEILLTEALGLLSEFELSNETYSMLATSCANSGNMEMYEEALGFLSDDSSKRLNLGNFVGFSFFELALSEKAKFIDLLRSQRQSKGIKLNIELAEKFMNADLDVNEALIDFCIKHKRSQPDDEIFSFLMYHKRYKEGLEFINQVKGRNRFAQYGTCFKALLKQGEVDTVIAAIEGIRDNFTKAEVIRELLELGKTDIALSLNSKLFKKAQQLEFTDNHFVVHYIRANEKAKALELLSRGKSEVSRIGILHQLGRMCLGLKFGSTG